MLDMASGFLPLLLFWMSNSAFGFNEAVSKKQAIKIALVSVFNDGVQIKWHSEIKDSIEKCEFSVHPKDGTAIVTIENFSQGLVNENVDIRGLAPNTSYTIFGVCMSAKKWITYTSNHIEFTTTEKGSYAMTDHRRDNPSADDSASPNPGVYKQKQPMGSPIDVALGIIFGLVGLIIVVIGAFYFWRKVQARRRIRLFLRHEDSGSFPDLRDPDTGSESPTSLRFTPNNAHLTAPDSLL